MSVLDNFFLKLGTVLSMTKDALLADFLGDLPSYAPDLQPLLEAKDRDTFMAKLGETGNQLTGFIECVFRRLGYDLSSFEENKELVELVTSIFSTAESLGESVQALAENGIPWEQELEEIKQANQPKKGESEKGGKKEEGKKDGDKKEEGKKEDKEQRFITPDDVFKDSDGKSLIHLEGDNGSLDISFLDPGDGKVGAVVKIASNLIDLIKKFRDLEWSKIEAEGNAFIKFLDDNYFTEKFAERLFDHILAVLLSKAREVFDEEIKEIARNIGNFKEYIENQIAQMVDPIAKTADEIIKKIEEIKAQIEAVKAQIEQEAEQAAGELKAMLRMLENELLALTKMSLGPFGTLGDLLDRIYHVLDFFGLLRKQTIEIAKYIPDSTYVNAVEKATEKAKHFADLLNDAMPDKVPTGEIDTKKIKALDEKAATAIAEIKGSIPAVEIYVIRWSRLEQLFTSPKEYFKEVFPIHDYDDAEAIVIRLVGLIRSFNPDIPDFSSITAILNDLLARLTKVIKEAGDGISKEIKTMIDAIRDFILEVKRVLEAYASKFKDKMSEAFEAVEQVAKGKLEEGKSLLDQLKSQVREAAAAVQAEAGTLLQGTKVALNDLTNLAGLDPAGKELLYKLFVKPLEELAVEKAAENGLLAGVDPGKWTAAIEKSFGVTERNAKGLATDYVEIYNDLKKRITTALDEKMWNARFRQAVTELQEEFQQQTAAIPTNLSELRNFTKESVNALLQGGAPKNPFSSFDFTAYFSILYDKVKSLIPMDLDLYYYKFRNVTVQRIGAIIKEAANLDDNLLEGFDSLAADAENRADALVNFASDVYAGYWPRLKDAFLKLVVNPILKAAEKAAKQWVKEFVQKLVEAVADLIDEKAVQDVADTVANAVGAATEMAQKAAELAQEILKAKQEGEQIDTWQEGIAFAIKIYGLIPDTVKQYVRDIISIPKIDVDFHLPDYKLDMKNKFLAVQLYELKPTKSINEKYNVGGNVSIQLLAFVGERTEKDEKGEEVVKTGLYLYPSFKGELQTTFALGAKHKLDLNASAGLNDNLEKKNAESSDDAKKAFNDGIGLFFTEKGDFAIDVIPIANLNALSAYLELYFARKTKDGGDVPKAVIYDSKVFGITVDNYPQKAYVGYSNSTFDAGYMGELDNLVFRLSLKKLNGFFDKLLSDDIKFSVEKLAVGYSYQKGLSIGGSASVRIPINKTIDLKAAKLSNLALEIGLPDLRGLEVGISTNLGLNLECVNFSLSDLGFGLKSNLLDSGWHFKDFNLSPTLKLPDGMGISIDLEGVKGAGALKWNTETGELRGSFQLVIVDLCGAGAWFILNTKPKDGVKFSFMGAVSAEFTPGIPIGMGFSITGIGGSLGLFRRIDTDRMQNAVHDGTLSTVLFAKDIDKNLDTVLENMTSFYPISKNNFFFGAMAQISFAEKVKVDLGLFIQAPDPVVIMIAGGLHFNVTDAADKLLSINANFLGMIDFSKGLSFDASLYDSYIVGIQFYGDIALRAYWAGDTKGFLLSAGGFHPQYKPEAGFNVGNLKRLGMKFDIDIVQLSMEEYFAVTSNTVQFGSDTRLKVGWDKFGLSGYMYYNVLFQFRPFAFMFDAGIGVGVKCGDWTLMSIDLYLEVSGPTPWHIKGKASFYFLLIKIKCSFTAEWGKKQQVGEQSTVLVIENYSESFEKNDNWTVISSDLTDKLVVTAPYKGEELMMNSSDTLRFSQEEVPLDVEMECFGESLPSVWQIYLTQVSIGSGETEKVLGKDPVSTSFAPSQFKKMTDQDKLSAPSYTPMHSGFAVRGDDDTSALKPTGVDESVELKIDGDGTVDLEAWKNAISGSTKATKAKANAVVTGPSAKSPKDPTLPQKITASVVKTHGKGIPRVYRPSGRRTADGFNRYIQELNASMCFNVKEKIEEVEEA